MQRRDHVCVLLKMLQNPSWGPLDPHLVPSLDWPRTCYEDCGEKSVAKVVIDGVVQEAQPNELLIDLINRTVPAAQFPTSAIAS